MEKFVARSGREVRAGREDGSLVFGKVNGYLDGDSAMDAEEFFQAKRDAELGRWRVPAQPNMVVYPRGGDGVRVFDEAQAYLSHVITRAAAMDGHHDATSAMGNARAYFEAHPERKPWDEAQDGEIWAITGAGGLEQPWRRVNGRWRSIGTDREHMYDAAEARAGRRIWPAETVVVEGVSSQAGLASFRGAL